MMEGNIRQWLRELGLDNYADAFVENEVEVRDLPSLTDDDLKELGLPLGPRRRILTASQNLQAPRLQAESDELPSQEPQQEPRQDKKRQEIPPAPPATNAERRHMTLMFCDMVGSTELAQQLDPEDLHDIMRRYQDSVAGAITRYGGHVARYSGDGVLAYFGWPRAYEDQTERAIRASLDAIVAVQLLTLKDLQRLDARIGVATGEVVVGDLIGTAGRDTEAVSGETPNLAARLQVLADPGQVIVCLETRRLVGEIFEFENLGEHTLKGFSDPVPSYCVLGESATESRFDALHGEHLMPLIGREHEINLILDRWKRAQEGEGQVVLLSGEPGIGKSRIIQGLRERLAEETLTPVSHYCSPHHTNSALFPVIRLLERAAGFEHEDTSDIRLDKMEAMIGRATDQIEEVAPLVANLLSIPTGDRYPTVTLSPDQQKERILEILIQQVEGLAELHPVLAIYEDVHWIDPSTLEMLGLLMERIRNRPVLILVTYRPEFSPPWLGHAHVTQLSLTRLTRNHGATIIERLTGGKALPPEVSQKILDMTDGVPLFVEELTKTVLEADLLEERENEYALVSALPSLAIPATLQDSLMARLDRSPALREVAQLVSVLGREFDYEMVQALGAMEETALRNGLDMLVAEELLYQRGTPPQSKYIFKHALIRDSAYHSLLKQTRQQLHRYVANALERQTSDGLFVAPELLAYHYTGASMAEEAITYWLKAARLSAGHSAYAEAIGHANEGLRRCCQTNANRSLHGGNVSPLCRTKLAPIGESSVTLDFENFSRCEMTFLIKEIAN